MLEHDPSTAFRERQVSQVEVHHVTNPCARVERQGEDGSRPHILPQFDFTQQAAQKSEQKGQKGAKKKGTEAKVVQAESKKVQSGSDQLAKLLKEIQEALAGTCKTRKEKEGAGAGCWREGVAERDQDGKGRAIQKWRPGRRIPTLLQVERVSAAPPRLEIDPVLWREVFLVQDDTDNGGVLTMELLRPLEWLEQHGVELGAWVAIDSAHTPYFRFRHFSHCGAAHLALP